MTPTDGTAQVDAEGELERSESANLAVPQPTSSNSAERARIALDEAKAEAKELGLDNNQVALLKAARADDPLSALRDHATLSNEVLSPPPVERSASAPGNEAKMPSMSAELAAAMEAVKRLSPEDLSAFTWWVRAAFPAPRVPSEATGSTGILTPISGWASAAAGLLRARTTA